MMHRDRRGFSLMEVMLATSILLGSSIALIELATIGRKQASSAYDLNVAQLLCQAKLNEIIAGVTTATTVEETEMEDNPGWFYSVETQPVRVRNLVAVKVTVFQVPHESQKSHRFSLVRWLPDRSLKSLSEPPMTNSNDDVSNSSRRISRREDGP